MNKVSKVQRALREKEATKVQLENKDSKVTKDLQEIKVIRVLQE